MHFALKLVSRFGISWGLHGNDGNGSSLFSELLLHFLVEGDPCLTTRCMECMAHIVLFLLLASSQGAAQNWNPRCLANCKPKGVDHG